MSVDVRYEGTNTRQRALFMVKHPFRFHWACASEHIF